MESFPSELQLIGASCAQHGAMIVMDSRGGR
ncbi:hypothetical protein ABH923_000127 [Leifsonia sp. EB41]